MKNIATMIAACCATLVLAGCGGGAGVESAGTRPTGPMASQYGQAQGTLIGMDARRLVAMLGTPRLDIRDRTVRKLQFTAGRCILDAYLYAPARGREPVTTHVDTRLATGEDVPFTSCGVRISGH